MLWNLLYVLGNLFRVSNMISCVALRPHGAPGHACFITSTYEPRGALGHARCRPPRQLEQISLEANTRCNTNFSRIFESVALHARKLSRVIYAGPAHLSLPARHGAPCTPSRASAGLRLAAGAPPPVRPGPSSPSAVHLCRR
jgi:hypothetical protein